MRLRLLVLAVIVHLGFKFKVYGVRASGFGCRYVDFFSGPGWELGLLAMYV